MNKFIVFLNEVKTELSKIVWPKRDDVIGSSIIVCLLAIVCSIILGAMDFGFGQIIKYLIS